MQGFMLAVLAILACTETLAQPVDPSNASALLNAPAAAPDKFSIIVVFRDLRSVLALRAMCSNSWIGFRLRSRALSLPNECHMPGICRRVYSHTVFGFSGEVTESELATVNRCLPRAVWYRELDGIVKKAEDSSRQAHTNRRLHQQQMEQPNGFVAPRVTSFESFNASRSEQGGPIDMASFTGSSGAVFSGVGVKTQPVDAQLWNLDRIDQRALPLDTKYTFGSTASSGTGSGVTVYVVDSGIMATHQEFYKAGDPGQSRASSGFDFVEDDEEAQDCDGHGTHVAATAVGLKVGVAKDAQVVSVRILDCFGSGTISDTVAALDWVAANAQKPAVVTLSLGIQVGSWSRVLEDAVRSLVVEHGVTVVVASGNSAVDACYVAPANVPEVITVAATDLLNRTADGGTHSGDPEPLYQWSNTGPCIDLFSPGVDIFSACGGVTRCKVLDNQAYTVASGTSMAVPAVAGVASLYLEANRGASPAEVLSALVASATQGVLRSEGLRQGTPNKLLYSNTGGQVSAANGP